jgi:hypothetical protein
MTRLLRRETYMKPPFKSYSGDEPYIFISYAHKDRADVYPALSAMAEKGERIWYDEGIKPGKDWAAEIGVHIDNCAMVLWFVSKKSAARTNVTREIRYAKSRKKPILLIYVEDAELNGDNAADFANRQNIHMENCTTYGDLADKVGELARENGLDTNNGAYAGESLGSVSDKEIRLEQKRLRKQRTLRIAGVGGVIVAAIVLFFALCFAPIPRVAGMTLDEAVKAIGSSKFSYRETETYSDTVLPGEIISQSPLGGKYGFRFIPIILEVSLGTEPQMTTVPLVVGDEVDFGISKILGNMLFFAISAVPTEVKTAGMIDAQDIRAETPVPVETKLGVDVNASSAEEARGVVIDAIIKAGGAGLFADADGNAIPEGAFSADTARDVLKRIFVIEDDAVVLGDTFDVEDGRIVLTEENAGELLAISDEGEQSTLTTEHLSADYFIPDLSREYYFTYYSGASESLEFWSGDEKGYFASAIYSVDDWSGIDTLTVEDGSVYWEMTSSGSGAWYLDSGTHILFAPVKMGESWENNWTEEHKDGTIKSCYDKYTFTGWMEVTVGGQPMTAACIHHESEITLFDETYTETRDELYVKNVGFVGTTDYIMLTRIE